MAPLWAVLENVVFFVLLYTNDGIATKLMAQFPKYVMKEMSYSGN